MRMVVRTLIMLVLMLSVMAGSAREQDQLSRAKLLLFDQKWEQALKVLDDYLATDPESKELAQALYFRASCLKELDRLDDAISAYRSFLDVSENETLREEATISMIDLSMKLADRGDVSARARLISMLARNERTIRYYAAFKLSYAKDKSLARRAVPVLRTILGSEKDAELKERARLALLRIDPSILKSVPDPDQSGALFRIVVLDKKTGETKVTVTIPMALARLALSALPQEEKDRLAAEGYDLDTIMKTMMESGEVVRIEDEEATIRIWIEK